MEISACISDSRLLEMDQFKQKNHNMSSLSDMEKKNISCLFRCPELDKETSGLFSMCFVKVTTAVFFLQNVLKISKSLNPLVCLKLFKLSQLSKSKEKNYEPAKLRHHKLGRPPQKKRPTLVSPLFWAGVFSRMFRIR